MVVSEETLAISRGVKLLLSDVDGVLTDGKLIYSDAGLEAKAFHVRDGLGVKLWRRCGYKFGLITARESKTVQKRADELNVDFVFQSSPEKFRTIGEIAEREAIELSEICYVGDDLHDLSAIEKVGLGAAVNDAADEIQTAADLVLSKNGGDGAIRELVEFLLKSKGEWEKTIKPFFA
ncbi:MAG: HAD hydrolase family protein [Planctomycetota bacterium]|nr:HAD hydrolase family protein [Planctomycetota bacterium]